MCAPTSYLNESKAERKEQNAKTNEKIVNSRDPQDVEFDLPGGRHFKGQKIRKKITSGKITWLHQNVYYDGEFDHLLP